MLCSWIEDWCGVKFWSFVIGDEQWVIMTVVYVFSFYDFFFLYLV